MKQGAINRFVSVFVTMMMTFACFFVTPVTETFAADQQELGNKDGFDYELWNQWGQGSATMQVGSNGAFSCSWDGIENCLFRTGKKLEKTKKYSEYNGMYIDYDVEYEPKGNSYMCVYGWTENPTVEYYIVEAWGSWRPPGSNNPLGTVEANGHTYDIYKTVRENQPSIHGTETFYQYWSVRQDNPAQNNVKKEITGRISVSKHFEAWEKAGLDMSGTMYEVALNIEGYQSNGSANVKKNGLVIGEGDGDGGSSIVTPPTPVEPDENGYFFHSDFESTVDSWSARGDASVKETSAETFAGNKSLGVTGRTDSWNGAARSLSTSVFVPENSYSFSVAVMQNKTASEDFKLTLQYDKDGETNYSTIATATGAKGEWVQLANTSYTIPAGATNLIIYTETDGTTTDYFMDEAIGAEKGKVIPFSSPSSSKLGDLNGDGKVDAADLQELQNFILGKKATATLEVSDMNGDGVINSFDLVLLRQTVVNPQQSTPQTPSINTDSSAFMTKIKSSITNDVPSSITNGTNGVTTQEITYYSTVAGKNKQAVVILPENYSTSKKYPVVYVNHGIMGSHNDMVSYCKTIGGNLMKNGEAVDMILVSTAMYTSKTSDQCSGITPEEAKNYDAFREDLIECLMPYIEKNYSVKTGRENTAICGFSMGGRESLYIGITRPEYFGYIGAACPAPGITPAQDSFMVHEGNMQPSEFKIQNHAYDPYLLMITGGTNDGAVGTDANSSSMRILNALKNSGFHATFFYVSDWIRNNQAEVKTAYDMGMEVANHTKSHPNLSEKSASEIRSEYDSCATALKNIIGTEPSKLLRLPYLASNDTVKSTLSDVPLITCSIDTQDWNGATSSQIIDTVKNAMSNGSLNNAIVLCHETYDSTAEAMEYLCPYLKEQGWQIVTISELFAVNGKELNGGQIYTKCN